MATDLHIKNMVCNRCILVVSEELKQLGLHPVIINLGLVTLEEDAIADDVKLRLVKRLNQLGFELLDSAKSKIIDKIKSLLIDKIHHQGRLELKVNWSALIADTLNQDYNTLSALFSSVAGITIEHYIISQKIEKAKELIYYNEMNFSEIAFLLGYSSVQHLSTQFKKVTGQTPSQFKKLRGSTTLRKSLDLI